MRGVIEIAPLILLGSGVIAAVWLNKPKLNLFYLVFIAISAVSGAFFVFTSWNHLIFGTGNIWYLLIIPLFYLLGPALFYSTHRIKVTSKGISFIVLPILIFYLIGIWEIKNPSSTILFGHFIPYPKNALILLGYPIHTLFWAILVLSRLSRKNNPFRHYYLPAGILFFTPYLMDYVFVFITGKALAFQNNFPHEVILSGAVALILWDMYLGATEFEEEVTHLKYSDHLKLNNFIDVRHGALSAKVLSYLEDFSNQATSDIVAGTENKAEFISQSPFSEDEWAMVFKECKINFIMLRKIIRVKRALEIVEQSDESVSIDTISRSVGYKSRTTLYKATEELLGIQLPQIRNEILNG